MSTVCAIINISGHWRWSRRASKRLWVITN